MNESRGVLRYDPDCGFCTRMALRLQRWRWGPHRGPAGYSLTVDPDRALREIPFVHPDGHVTYGAHAFADALATGPAPLAGVGRLLATRPVLALAQPLYRVIAKHRQHLPGGTPACALRARSSTVGAADRQADQEDDQQADHGADRPGRLPPGASG